MKHSKLEFRTPDDIEAVYYEAFMHCDTDVMTALWADGDVLCIHPGSGAIVGHEAVTRSWAHIFTHARRPDIKFTPLKKIQVDGLAVHLVIEEISGGGTAPTQVLATNVYRQFDSGWLMIEHHASLMQVNTRGQTLQ